MKKVTKRVDQLKVVKEEQPKKSLTQMMQEKLIEDRNNFLQEYNQLKAKYNCALSASVRFDEFSNKPSFYLAVINITE